MDPGGHGGVGSRCGKALSCKAPTSLEDSELSVNKGGLNFQ